VLQGNEKVLDGRPSNGKFYDFLVTSLSARVGGVFFALTTVLRGSKFALSGNFTRAQPLISSPNYGIDPQLNTGPERAVPRCRR
jgi:hypothetical protein